MLFEPPKEIQTSVFTTIPEHLHIKNRKSAWSFGKGSDHLHSFIEGPSFDRLGNLYVTDIPYGRILKITPDKEWSVVTEYDGWPNGLKIHKDGRFFIADHRHGIMQFDPASGKVTPVLDHVRREGLKGTNDLIFSSNGDLYFTDQGQTGMQDPSGRVYRLRPDGQVDLLISNVPSPNGLALSPNQQVLYVAATRANQIWRMPLHPDGTTSKVGAYIQLSGGSAGPDGVASDATGGLAVAHCGLGSIWIFSKLGEPLYRLRSCAGLSTTNIAYGGQENKTLYITESDTGSVLMAKVPEAGLGMFGQE